MKKNQLALLLVILFSAVFSACKKDPEVKTTGTLKGVVKDAQTSGPLSNVRIILFDAGSNAPTGTTLTTGADGSYAVEIQPGSYYLRLYKQGYENIPGKEISPIPFSIAVNQVVENPYKMQKSAVIAGGFISGKVTAGGSPVSGVLVVASDGTNGYSSISDKEGSYYIYNLPAATYSVKGWMADHNSTEETKSVTANTETANVNLSLTKGTAGKVTGQISFLATGSVDIDVALTHPVTREPIPGLTATTSGSTYTISNVPNGTYLARATYKNDTKVMDPDWIIKNGEPFVTVNGGSATRDFSVTGAVGILNPTNAATTTEPILVNSTTPTFSWSAYSSTDDYVMEVSDANGNVVWGGFSDNFKVKNITIPKDQTSITYNADGNAKEPLKAGSVYRWRIFASKNDIKELVGWKLISVSEDQRGLIKVQP